MDFNAGQLGATAQPTQGYNLTMAIVGAVAGALALGLVYGVVGRFVAEYKYIAIAVGVVSGTAAVRLGGGQSLVGGVGAAIATLVGMLVGKLLIQPGEGASWVAYHTTMFDILFCYIGAPVTAFATAGTPLGEQIRQRLPF
jgi:hypothetical protein